MNIADEIWKAGPLEKVSPSTWLSLQQCAWRILLARHFGQKPLLAPHPAGVFGQVLHSALEKISTGTFADRADFEAWWEKAIAYKETKLQSDGWGEIVPLKDHVRNYGLKKVLVRLRLEALAGKTPASKSPVNQKMVERDLTALGGKLVGRLDCIIWQGDYAEIRDYKTGAIFEDSQADEPSSVKADYRLQLQLYALLFRETFDRWPDRLTLEDISGEVIEVAFSPQGCEALRDEILERLLSTNRLIEARDDTALAQIGKHCGFCAYRPVCQKYSRQPHVA